MGILGDFLGPAFSSEPRAAHFRPAFQIRTRATSCVHVYGRDLICDG